MNRASQFRFQTDQERENDRKNRADAENARRERRKETVAQAVQQIGPIIRHVLGEFFRSQGLSIVDESGAEQMALFKEESGPKGHAWTAWSRIKTGTHTEYRSGAAHVLDEETVYTVTVSLVATKDGVPLLRIRDYATSKLVGGIPVTASRFPAAIPSALETLLEKNTGVRYAPLNEYLAAEDN